MKRNFWLFLFVPLFLSGCGDIEWFPDDSTDTGSTTQSAPRLTKAYTPAAILAGKASTLTFTITNVTGSPAQSGLAFVDQFAPSLTITAGQSTCGGNLSVLNSKIIFISGQLAAGTPSCTVTATVGGTTAGSFTNKATDVTQLQGGLVNGITDQTLKLFSASVTDSTGDVIASNLTAVLKSSDVNVRTYDISVEVSNFGAAAANVTVEVEAVDANGVPLVDNGIPVSQTFIDTVLALSTQALGPIAVDVPIAVADKIQFWHIVSVLAQ